MKIKKTTLLDENTNLPINAHDRISSEKSLRADAKRNREKILKVAYEVFAEEGLSVPIDEIAQRAGVGIGTIYRHFPTKEALFEQVVNSHKQQLVDEGKSLFDHDDPGEAFFSYFSHIIKQGVKNKAFIDALVNTDLIESQCTSLEKTQEFHHIFIELLKRAQQSGAVRNDVNITDLIILLVSILQSMEKFSGDISVSERILSIVFDGLRCT